MHPMRLTAHVWQQIKHLILWRCTFYVHDFRGQRPMYSFKELQRLYLVFCALSKFSVPSAWGIGARGCQQALDPIAEARGLRA
jgi:hypothetical protein